MKFATRTSGPSTPPSGPMTRLLVDEEGYVSNAWLLEVREWIAGATDKREVEAVVNQLIEEIYSLRQILSYGDPTELKELMLRRVRWSDCQIERAVGDGNYMTILKQLREDGYDGPVSAERLSEVTGIHFVKMHCYLQQLVRDGILIDEDGHDHH